MSVKTSELNKTRCVMQYFVVSSENSKVPNPRFVPKVLNTKKLNVKMKHRWILIVIPDIGFHHFKRVVYAGSNNLRSTNMPEKETLHLF